MIKILIVDDESGIRSLLSEILSEEGFLVYEAEDAARARQMLAKDSFNLILLDIWMPDTDGITLLKEWVGRDLLRTTYVVVMSGHGTIETAMEAVKLGAKDFLEKPISMKRLLETVHRVIREWNATHTQPVPHTATPGDAPPVKTFNQAAKSDPGKEVRTASLETADAVPTVLSNGRTIPARTDKTVAQLFRRFRKSLNSEFAHADDAARLHADILTRRKNTRGGSDYVLKTLAGLLRDIVRYRPEYESADWLLGPANRALKRRFFTDYIAIVQNRMRHGAIASPEGGYYDQAIRQVMDGGPQAPYASSGQALQRSLEFLTRLEDFRRDIPGMSDCTVLPEPEYVPENEPNEENLRDVVLHAKDDESLFDTQDQFCTDLDQRFRPTPMAFPELNAKSLHKQVRAAIAMTTLPTMPLVYVRAYDLLIDYNLPVRQMREQVERSYFLTHLLRTNLTVAVTAKNVGVERTHLYRKLKGLGINPKELNQAAKAKIRAVKAEAQLQKAKKKKEQ